MNISVKLPQSSQTAEQRKIQNCNELNLLVAAFDRSTPLGEKLCRIAFLEAFIDIWDVMERMKIDFSEIEVLQAQYNGFLTLLGLPAESADELLTNVINNNL